MSAPYRRGYHHTKAKGHEATVECGYCGRNVPRWKTFVTYKGFRITDPVLRKQFSMTSTFNRKIYVCPGCARFRGIVRVGRSRKTRRGESWY